MREQKRLVQKSVRDLEREKTGMERTEAALIADIKKAAKAGQVRVGVGARHLAPRSREFVYACERRCPPLLCLHLICVGVLPIRDVRMLLGSYFESGTGTCILS